MAEFVSEAAKSEVAVKDQARLLEYRDPMGIYAILFSFAAATGSYIGDPDTRPMSQGFPLTEKLPGGPPLPDSVEVTDADRMYPKADGLPELRQALADYYNRHYGCELSSANIMICAGGRPGLVSLLWMMKSSWKTTIEETEYTPYWDLLKHCKRDYAVVKSNEANRFRPSLQDHIETYAYAFGDPHEITTGQGHLFVRSNPCNPTGVVMPTDELQHLARSTAQPGFAAVVDEAYEFFVDPKPESVLSEVKNLDDHNLFVVGAATKGLQSPGARVGWVVGPSHEIEVLRNYSSYAMGGVSQVSQRYVLKLLEPQHVDLARVAVAQFYTSQRTRYCSALVKLGFTDFTGAGGFYCWVRLPHDITAKQFNDALFKQKAAILPGPLCDMQRRGADSPLAHFVRVSFGPRKWEDFPGDISAISAAIQSCAEEGA